VLPPFAIERPESLEQALALIDDDRIPYWGGTELLLAMKMGLLRPDTLVDLKRLPEFSGVRVDSGVLVIGAGATHDEVARAGVVAEHVPLLVSVEQGVGNARVRAQGTVGGNLCFAEPRSDLATVLVALDATVRLVSSSGERTVPVREFVLGAYWTAREPNELLVDIRIPLPAATGVYLKFQTVERPTVSVAAVRRGATGGRLVIGAVSEIPYVLDADDLASVDAEGLADQIEPIPDLTGSVRYKRHVTGVYIGRAIAALNGAGA
jgi:carbon-monoxide dehydrogenase medium subunit